MSIRAFPVFWSLLTVTVAALSLGPSFAHVLEAPPRLTWAPDLWREATVFNAQFRLFAEVGAPLDVAAVLCPAVLSMLLWRDRPALYSALAATRLYALAVAAGFMLVNPANAVLATWAPGPIPADFDETRLRWETGHMAVAALKAVGFITPAGALLSLRRG